MKICLNDYIFSCTIIMIYLNEVWRIGVKLQNKMVLKMPNKYKKKKGKKGKKI